MKLLFSVLPGLAGVAADELQVRCGLRVGAAERVRNAELVAVTTDRPELLLGLRTAEDVFAVVGRVRLSGQLADVRALPGASLWGGPLREALAVWSRVTGRPLVKRQVVRVVVQADDARWRQYRRQELTLAAERGLLGAGSSWRVNREAAPLEVWLHQLGRELVVSVRLTAAEHRQRGGRIEERAAALRPTVAAAMAWLAGPEADDVFLDPMCGTGTILLERAAMGRYELLLGGDNDPQAVAATLANFGPRHQPRRIERWDVRQLPLAAGSVTKIACNLPWGRQIGEVKTLPELYRAAVAEMDRVLAPGGRMVLLTSEWEVLKLVLQQRPELHLERTISNIEVLGRRADMLVCRKK